MKHVDTWLNEKEYKMYTNRAKKLGVTPYARTKTLILKDLEREEQRVNAITAIYWYICYAVTITTILFLLVF